MEMRTIGSGGPRISVVGFGAWEAGGDMWGPNRSDRQVISAIRAGLDAGMTWIDTAEVYGRGRSEELVGKAIAGLREELLVFTKVAPRPAGSGFRPDEVKSAVRGSLAKLRTERIDLYQLHWPDTGVPVEETWAAMAELQDEGLARHIGVSNFSLDLVRRCAAIRHVDAVQNELSLLHQDDRGEFLGALSANGTGYLAYSPLALGVLTGALARDHRFDEGDFRAGRGRPGYFRSGSFEPNLEKVRRLGRVASSLGTTTATLALRWVVEQKGVTAAIAGSRNAEHTTDNAGAGDLSLDEATVKEIQGIFD
jgi:aryl-alcohol dehydrogenase-like predicted oxidoreductase